MAGQCDQLRRGGPGRPISTNTYRYMQEGAARIRAALTSIDQAAAAGSLAPDQVKERRRLQRMLARVEEKLQRPVYEPSCSYRKYCGTIEAKYGRKPA